MTSFLARILLVLLGGIMIISGLVTVLSPNINNIFLPIEIDPSSTAIATLMRTYAGFFIAFGYLTIRFVYSSSKVQIGSILLSIMGSMILARSISLIYDGVTQYALITLGMAVILFLALYVVQKNRKNQISYDL
tara:strand:- start:97 stop:498 length:402 start_codon:yes stop_codon:yes gene_type:complete